MLHLRSTYVLLIFAIFVTKPYVFMLIFRSYLLDIVHCTTRELSTTTYSELKKCASNSTDTLNGRADCAVHDLKIHNAKLTGIIR